MDETKVLNQTLDTVFFNRLGVNSSQDNLIPNTNFKTVITKELKLKDLTERLAKSRQEKVTIKEVVIENELDLINSLKQLKSVYKEELKQALGRLDNIYQNELMKINELYHSEVVGERLLDIVKTVSKAGWCLLMKGSSVNLCKFYSPYHEVVIGISDEKSEVREYDSPICELKAIYINILHTVISSGTIHISTVNQHPNANVENLGIACTGSLDERPIPLDDSEKLLSLLNEITTTYERVHLDSTYFEPDQNYSVRKDGVWKTTA